MRRTTTRPTVLVLLLIVSCINTREVRAIIDETNAQAEANLILGETGIPELLDPNPDAPTTNRLSASQTAAIQRIDAFIAKNPHLKSAANALIIRKALILKASGNHNLAKAAMANYDATVKGSVRDYGLVQSFDVLTWWRPVAAQTDPNQTPIETVFDQKIAELTTAIGKVKAIDKGSDIHYYLAATRAYMHYKRALRAGSKPGSTPAERDPAPHLKIGLCNYAKEFSPEDHVKVQLWMANRVDDQRLRGLSTERLRWWGHAAILLKLYNDKHKSLFGPDLPLPPECAWLRNPPPPSPQ